VCKREGLVKPEMMNDWMQKSNVVLRGGGLDESPHCYKSLPEVLAAHSNTIRVLHTLTPVGVGQGKPRFSCAILIKRRAGTAICRGISSSVSCIVQREGKTMTRKSVAAAVLFLSFSAVSAFAATWHGTVSDEMCNVKHEAATPADMACAQKCFKMGSPAVLIVDGKVFKIANQDAVKDVVGHKVVVTGTLTGDTIHIDKLKS
jgi:hypothetical protein